MPIQITNKNFKKLKFLISNVLLKIKLINQIKGLLKKYLMNWFILSTNKLPIKENSPIPHNKQLE